MTERDQSSSLHVRVVRGWFGAAAGWALSAAVGSLAAPHADLAQVLGIMFGSMIVGGLWGSR